MHKGIIILTKAEDREDALANVETFLEQYQHYVWDWYAIGNGWHNTLAPTDKLKSFHDWVRQEYKDVFKNGFYCPKDLEENGNREKIQAKWNELGLSGKNPFYSSLFGCDDTEDDYNVVPLNTCLDTVKKWLRDLKKEKEEAWNDLLKAKEDEDKGDKKRMSGYYAKKYSDLVDENFSNCSNVFNADTYEAEKLPKDDEINEYWAVMVDIHF